jgi:MFS family permease
VSGSAEPGPAAGGGGGAAGGGGSGGARSGGGGYGAAGGDRLGRFAMYVGGLLGPMGGGIVAPLLPELAGSFGVTRQVAALSLTTYLVPFAALQLASGTLGERWGRRRSVRAGYLVYVAASLLCAAAPDIGVFLAGRAVQGAANAFTSPLLVAGLAELVPAARLGRAIGVYGSLQAAGQSLAPLVGGVAGALTWRLAFVGVAAVALALTFLPPPGRPRPGMAAPPWRALVALPVARLCLAAATASAGAIGLPFLVALLARDRFGAGEQLSGLVLVGFGLAGLLLAPLWGRLCDRFGAGRAGIAGAVAVAALVAAVGQAPTLAAVAATWALAGTAGSLLTVALQNLAVRQVPANRGGAVSVVSAFRFGGMALAPLLWLPLYHSSAALAFAGAAGCALVCAAALLPAARAVPAGSGGRPAGRG